MYFITDLPDIPDMADLPDDIHMMPDDEHELLMIPHMREDYSIHDTDEMSEVNYIQDKGMILFNLLV